MNNSLAALVALFAVNDNRQAAQRRKESLLLSTVYV
jgi:hypothetical protein